MWYDVTLCYVTVQDISLGVSAPKWFDKDASPADRWRSFDALTTYGVKLWQPELREWCEISVQGNVSRPRTVFDEVGERLGAPFSNVLTDGSIIDICGAVLIFQSPVTMAKLIRKHVSTAYMTVCTYTMTILVNSCSVIIVCHLITRGIYAIALLHCNMPGLLLYSTVLHCIALHHIMLYCVVMWFHFLSWFASISVYAAPYAIIRTLPILSRIFR